VLSRETGEQQRGVSKSWRRASRIPQDVWYLAMVRLNRGDVALGQGDSATARTLYQEAVELHDQTGDAYMRTLTVMSLGEVELKLGDLETAREHFMEGLVNSPESSLPMLVWFGLAGLAAAEAETGDALRSARLLGAAQGFADSIGQKTLPLELAWCIQAERTLLERLGSDQLEEAITEGHALDGAKAVAFALGGGDGGG
jgi:tetratricopeptide (TPR) repeat protein